jgi:hypothetical protein
MEEPARYLLAGADFGKRPIFRGIKIDGRAFSCVLITGGEPACKPAVWSIPIVVFSTPDHSS